MSRFSSLWPVLVVGVLLGVPAPGWASPEVTMKAREFIADHDKRVRPLDVAASLAWWNANTTGKDEDFKKKEEAQNRIDEALADSKTFAELKAIYEKRKDIDDPVAARAIQVLYLLYLEKQVDTDLLKKMTSKADAIEKAFNEYRAKVD